MAKDIAEDAFLSGAFFDGKDLRHFKSFGRHAPAEVRRALELGKPPEFDGIKCSECGKRFRNERDHLEPFAAGGPSSTTNNEWKCHECHLAKTERDRRAGKLKPPVKEKTERDRKPGKLKPPEKRGPPGP